MARHYLVAPGRKPDDYDVVRWGVLNATHKVASFKCRACRRKLEADAFTPQALVRDDQKRVCKRCASTPKKPMIDYAELERRAEEEKQRLEDDLQFEHFLQSLAEEESQLMGAVHER